jgi:hypothetical protein
MRQTPPWRSCHPQPPAHPAPAGSTHGQYAPWLRQHTTAGC